MTEETKLEARVGSNALLDRVLRRVHLHTWTPYRRYNDAACTIFFGRRCGCGADEVQNAGPMGDRKWRGVSEPWRHQFERDDFDAAVERPNA